MIYPIDGEKIELHNCKNDAFRDSMLWFIWYGTLYVGQYKRERAFLLSPLGGESNLVYLVTIFAKNNQNADL